MGGCYSTASNEVAKSPRHKLPKERPGGRHTNGVAAKEADVEVYGVKPTPDESETLIHTTSVGTHCENEDDEKKVVPSDSGIESLSPNSLREESESPSHTTDVDEDKNSRPASGCPSEIDSKPWYNQTSDSGVGTDSNEENVTPPKETNAPMQNYCSCGPRHAGKSTWQKTSAPFCKTHMNSPKYSRNSDISGLKSSFRDFMRKADKKVRLSWKSSDSLDINKQMTNQLDRTKSEASEIFKDDVSFCAPLAQFDSVDVNLDRQNSKNRISTLSTASEIEAVARDICKCEFYANNLASELDTLVPERHESFPSERTEEAANKANDKDSGIDGVHSETTNNVDSEQSAGSVSLIGQHTDQANLSQLNESLKKKVMEKHVVKQISLASLSSSVRPSLSSLADVTMTTHEGRDMVMIDVDTYTQILEELSLLKTKLSQLTSVIQEDPELDQAFQLMDAINFEDSLIMQDTVGSETDLSC